MKKTQTKKKQQWDRLNQKVDKIVDGVGYPVDDGIKEVVVALWAHEFPTQSSCEGHLDRGGGAPWVIIGKDPSPEDLKELKGNSIPVREVFIKYPNLKKIRESNLKIQSEILKLLGQFYKNRAVLEDERLILTKSGIYGTARLINQGSEIQEINSKVKQAERLTQYQKEMEQFAAFLRFLI